MTLYKFTKKEAMESYTKSGFFIVDEGITTNGNIALLSEFCALPKDCKILTFKESRLAPKNGDKLSDVLAMKIKKDTIFNFANFIDNKLNIVEADRVYFKTKDIQRLNKIDDNIVFYYDKNYPHSAWQIVLNNKIIGVIMPIL